MTYRSAAQTPSTLRSVRWIVHTSVERTVNEKFTISSTPDLGLNALGQSIGLPVALTVKLVQG